MSLLLVKTQPCTKLTPRALAYFNQCLNGNIKNEELAGWIVSSYGKVPKTTRGESLVLGGYTSISAK